MYLRMSLSHTVCTSVYTSHTLYVPPYVPSTHCMYLPHTVCTSLCTSKCLYVPLYVPSTHCMYLRMYLCEEYEFMHVNILWLKQQLTILCRNVKICTIQQQLWDSVTFLGMQFILQFVLFI